MNELPLNTLFCGRIHQHFQVIDSTNSEAQKLCKNEEIAEGLLITAEIQQKGRGYAGNDWVTEAGKNITMTLVLKPTFLEAKCQFNLNKAVTIAIYDTISRYVNSPLLKIKWPNDLLFNGRKLCGILIENTLQSQFLEYSFIGIGLNVNQLTFPAELKYATSLAVITNKKYELTEILAALCENIEARYLQLKKDELELLDREYMSNLFQLDEWSDYIIAGKKIKGKIIALNAEGRLQLDTEEGIKSCGFKEIEFVMS